MKEFSANIIYRGRSFDVRFCAKNMEDAAKRIDVTKYYIKTYVGSGAKIDEPYDGIYVKPYGTNSINDIGHNRWILFSEAKSIIDRVAKEKMKNLLDG